MTDAIAPARPEPISARFTKRARRSSKGRRPFTGVGGYRYLPGFAILCSKTFATLPPGQAYIIWIGIMEGLALLAALLVWMRTPEGWNRVAAIALLLLNTPYMLEVHMGQFTFATFVLTSAAVVLLDRKPAGARGRWWTRAAGWLRTALAALIFATASWVKIYPLVSSPTLIRRRGGWLCLGLAAAAIWLTSVSFYQTHPGTFEQFMKINLSAGFGGMDAGNHGLAHVIFLAGKQLNGRWEPDLWARVVKYWTLAVLIPTALAVLFSREKSVALGTLALLTAHVLCYKHVWEHHYKRADRGGAHRVLALARRARNGAVWQALPVMEDVVRGGLPTASRTADSLCLCRAPGNPKGLGSC